MCQDIFPQNIKCIRMKKITWDSWFWYILKLFFTIIYCTHGCHSTCGDQRITCRSLFFPSTIWVLGIDIRWSELLAKAFTLRAIFWPLITFSLLVKVAKQERELKWNIFVIQLFLIGTDVCYCLKLWTKITYVFTVINEFKFFCPLR